MTQSITERVVLQPATAAIRVRRRVWDRGIAVHVAALALLVMILFPVLWMLQLSFRPSDDVLSPDLAFTPTLENYRALWTGNFPGSFANSFAASSLATLLSLALGCRRRMRCHDCGCARGMGSRSGS